MINTIKDLKRPKIEPNFITAKFDTNKDQSYPIIFLHPEGKLQLSDLHDSLEIINSPQTTEQLQQQQEEMQ